ncbi:MAG: radical SAM family heme chaperone HemW [Aggregatilineales bacterium]
MAGPLALYLHVPFCRTKCTYCAFNTYTNQDKFIAPFVEALRREIKFVGERTIERRVFSVFLGGGTPSLLSPQQIGSIIETIAQNFDLEADAEISLEGNPNDITVEYARALRDTGVNRISLGMQSANQNELQLFARRHDNDQTARAVSAARAAGFNNLNLDLIYGIPHQTLSHWRWTLEQTLTLQPEHVSLYALGLEEGTPMYEWVNRGHLPVPDDDLAADMYELATDLLAEARFTQYEISNWSKPGYQCRHNLQYWRNLPYLGMGPSAHGYAGNKRYAVVLAPLHYIKALANSESHTKAFPFPLSPAVDEDMVVTVDRINEITETLLMGLRLTQEGVERARFHARFGVDLMDVHGATIERFAEHGLLEITEQRVRLTRSGRLLSNSLFRELV